MTNLNHNNAVIDNDEVQEGSLNCCMLHGIGKHLSNEVTLDADNTTASINVFEISKCIEVKELNARITEATTLVNCTNVYFDIWDGTLSVPLNTGVDISGYGVGAYLVKDKDVGEALTALNNATCGIIELADKKSHQPFKVIQKIGVSTYLRLNYTTTDSPIDAKIEVYSLYKIINSGEMA